MWAQQMVPEGWFWYTCSACGKDRLVSGGWVARGRQPSRLLASSAPESLQARERVCVCVGQPAGPNTNARVDTLRLARPVTPRHTPLLTTRARAPQARAGSASSWSSPLSSFSAAPTTTGPAATATRRPTTAQQAGSRVCRREVQAVCRCARVAVGTKRDSSRGRRCSVAVRSRWRGACTAFDNSALQHA